MQKTTAMGKTAAEAWTLALLFAIYLAITINAERRAQQTTKTVTPSSFNTKSLGLKAYYLLLDQQGFPVDRLQAPWQRVDSNDGLLIVSEPADPDRPVLQEEITALKKWLEAGGTLLYFVSEPPREANTAGMPLGDIEVVSGSGDALTVAPEKRDSPYFNNVKSVTYDSLVRLKPGSKGKYVTLLEDDDGVLLMEKTIGKGHIVVSALGDIAGNATIRKGDNVVLLVNFAASRSNDKTIEFDEYHHGIGFTAEKGETGSLWAATPLPLRLALYAGFLLGAALLYNNNRMFGRLKEAPLSVYRNSSDYVGSAATLLHRAGAADLALSMLYERFVRDLRQKLDVPPNAEIGKVIGEAEKKYSVSGPQLQDMLTRCEVAVQGKRLRETEMLQLARQIEMFRRVCQLV